MGYDIAGKNGKGWGCNNSAWGRFLDVAIAFGWKPKGAIFPPGTFDDEAELPSVIESYFSNSWQRVTDEDARAMGAALSLAVDAIRSRKDPNDMPDDQVSAIQAFLDVGGASTNKKLKQIGQDLARLATRLQELADVANSGGFVIC
jgi:hypothetical protein